MKYYLAERLTFDQLFRLSTPERVTRSLTVRGPPLEVHSYQNQMYYAFNYKSHPSTTGLRHRGYVKFLKPKDPNKPLQHIDCIVDCSCPDYKFRWAWANKQRGASQVGPQSMNQAWNKAPRKTNPSGRPGLCKHILATRRFIYGMLSSFPEEIPDTAEKLDKLTKYAQKRWIDFSGQVQAAKDREAEVRRRQQLRNVVGPDIEPEEVPTERAPSTQGRKLPEPEETTQPFDKVKPPPLPPETSGKPKPMQPVKPVPKAPKGKPLPGGAYPMADSKAARDFQNLINETVVNPNANMNALQDAIKLVEEMEADELAMSPTTMEEPLEPSEPPVSDSAIGADTEEETALGLLRQMRDFLAQLSAALAPEGTSEETGEEEIEGGAMPPEPPADLEEPTGEEGEGAPEGEAAAEEEDEEPRNRRPVEA